eukprot:scaffold93405_cov28-Prasinocladus_malaysianus.AAC.3
MPLEGCAVALGAQGFHVHLLQSGRFESLRQTDRDPRRGSFQTLARAAPLRCRPAADTTHCILGSALGDCFRGRPRETQTARGRRRPRQAPASIGWPARSTRRNRPRG